MNKTKGDAYINVKNILGGTVIGLNIEAVRRRIAQRGSVSSGQLTHKAFPVADAGTGTTIECYLDTDATGDVITVNCSIAGGSDLNEAIPKLTDGLLIFVKKFGDDWYFTTVLTGYEECTCEAPA
jgi:hypothetical protein